MSHSNRRSLKVIYWLVSIVLIAGLLLLFAAMSPRLIAAKTVFTHKLEHSLLQPKRARLLVIGDQGSGGEPQKEVAQLMERLCVEKQIDAVVLIGDNFYPSGVESVDDPQWQTKFEQMYNSPCLAEKKFYAILGNHDYRGNEEAVIQYTGKSDGRWNLPARYYRVEFGGFLELIALDTKYKDYCEISWLCSFDWAVSRSIDSQALWKIMLIHHPVFYFDEDLSSKFTFRDSAAYRNLACKSDVDFFFSGDKHNLQFIHGLYGDTDCRVKQFISGAGGAHLSPVNSHSNSETFAELSYGALYVDINTTRAELSFYRVGDTVPVYTHTHRKSTVVK